MVRLITTILENRRSCKLFTVVRLFCTLVRNLDHFSSEETEEASVSSTFLNTSRYNRSRLEEQTPRSKQAVCNPVSSKRFSFLPPQINKLGGNLCL